MRLHAQRAGLPWPAWDDGSDRAARMRFGASAAVRKLHDDPEVLARLARYCGVVAGREYSAPSATRPAPAWVNVKPIVPPVRERPRLLIPFGVHKCPACTFTIRPRLAWERLNGDPPQWRTVSPCCGVEVVTEPGV